MTMRFQLAQRAQELVKGAMLAAVAVQPFDPGIDDSEFERLLIGRDGVEAGSLREALNTLAQNPFDSKGRRVLAAVDLVPVMLDAAPIPETMRPSGALNRLADIFDDLDNRLGREGRLTPEEIYGQAPSTPPAELDHALGLLILSERLTRTKEGGFRRLGSTGLVRYDVRKYKPDIIKPQKFVLAGADLYDPVKETFFKRAHGGVPSRNENSVPEAKDQIRKAFVKGAQFPSAFGGFQVVGGSLGEGGNGLVYPIRLDEFDCAIKILAEPIGENASTRLKRFRREFFRLVNITQHANIIRPFHFEEIRVGGSRFPAIFMERCAGSLQRPPPAGSGRLLEEVLKVIELVCAALQHIHDSGIVHRDLKPENILRRADGSLLLADFGIAWFDPEVFAGTELTQAKDRVGNFKFSAPEQLDAKINPTRAADIYALGQLIYWLVYGEVIRGTGHKKLADADATLGPLDPIVERCVRQDPSQRFQTAAELLQALEDNDLAEDEDDLRVVEEIRDFESVLRKLAPVGLTLVEGDDIERVFRELDDAPTELWWTHGYANQQIVEFRKEGDSWLFDDLELNVERLWTMRVRGRIDHAFIVVKAAPGDPFPSKFEQVGADTRACGWYHDQWIGLEEVDDGYASLGGERLKLDGSERVRERPLRTRFLFLATKYNPILLRDADGTVEAIVTELESGKPVTEGILRPLLKLPKHRVSELAD